MIDASGLCEIIIIEVIRVYVTVLYLDVFLTEKIKCVIDMLCMVVHLL